MNVLLDVSSVSTPLTGIGRYSLELARHLSSRTELGRLDYLREDRVCEQFNTDFGEMSPRRETGPFRRALKSLLPAGLLLYPYRRFKSRRLAKTLLAYEHYIIHSPNFSLPPFNGKSVVTLHDLSVFHYPEFHPADRVSFLKEQIHASVEQADMLVTDSEFVRRELIDLFELDERRVKAVPLGVAPEYQSYPQEVLTERLEAYGLQDKSYFLSVGTIEPRKNLAGLLAAYLRLDKALRRRCPLVIVGAHGWGCETLVEEIEALARAGEVMYLSYVAERDLPYIYAGATTFCYLSFYEGFGLPVLEAMSSGVPVVCSNNSALPEVYGDAALSVEAGDELAATEALEKSVVDKAWRENAIDAGLERSREYRWERTAQEMVELYATLSD